MPLQDISMIVAQLQNQNECSELHKSLKPYQLAARWIPMAIGPFVDIDAALYAGAAKVGNFQQPVDTEVEDTANFERFLKFCPGLKQILRGFKGDFDLLKAFIGHLSAAACNARADDTSSCRKATADYVGTTVKNKSKLYFERKNDRGWNDPHTARLLCPLKHLPEFDDNPNLFMSNVLDGTIKLKATQWPSFLYPKGTVYNPECLDEGLFQGEVFIMFLRNIYTGPTSAFDGIRRASKRSKAEIHDMDQVSGRSVAYAAVQAYFSLSAIEMWSSNPQEGFFNLYDFFKRCVNIFESDPTDPWVVETIHTLTCQLPSLKRDYRKKRKRNVQAVSSDESDEDEAKIIYAQREARRQARGVANEASSNDTFSANSGRAEDGFRINISSEASGSGTNTPPLPPPPNQLAPNILTDLHGSHAAAWPVENHSDFGGTSEEEDSPPPSKRRAQNDKKGKSRASS